MKFEKYIVEDEEIQTLRFERAFYVEDGHWISAVPVYDSKDQKLVVELPDFENPGYFLIKKTLGCEHKLALQSDNIYYIPVAKDLEKVKEDEHVCKAVVVFSPNEIVKRRAIFEKDCIAAKAGK